MAYTECLTVDLCSGVLAQDIQEVCDEAIYSGIAPVGFIINFDDIASYVRDASNPHIIKSIVLKSHSRAYKFVQNRTNPFTGTNTALEVGDFANTFTATVSGYIPLDGAEVAKRILTPMATGKYVVIVRNLWEHKDENGNVDNRWQVYGINRGLTVSSMQQTRYENNDAWMVELQETGSRRASMFVIPERDCTLDSSARFTIDHITAVGDLHYITGTFSPTGATEDQVEITDALIIIDESDPNKGSIAYENYIIYFESNASWEAVGVVTIERCSTECEALMDMLNIAIQ